MSLQNQLASSILVFKLILTIRYTGYLFYNTKMNFIIATQFKFTFKLIIYFSKYLSMFGKGFTLKIFSVSSRTDLGINIYKNIFNVQIFNEMINDAWHNAYKMHSNCESIMYLT